MNVPGYLLFFSVAAAVTKYKRIKTRIKTLKKKKTKNIVVFLYLTER
jgi:hypothetical protein